MRNLSPINDNKDLTTKAYVDGCVSPKYEKPSDGIPKKDLAAAVQASLDKADTALQSHQSIKQLNTNNEAAQTPSSNEAIVGNGTINLHKISKTGSYNDLLNKPTGTLIIQKNGSNIQTFSANQTGNVTANITVPTKVSELTNDNGFITLLIANTSEEFDSFIVEDNIGRIVSYNGDLYLIEAKIDKNAPKIKVGDTINALYFDTTTTPSLSGKSGVWIVTDTYDVELTVVETGERIPFTFKDGLLSEAFDEERWLTWRQCAPERDENGNFVYQEIDGVMYPVMNETETIVFREYDAWVTNPPNPIGWLVDKVVVNAPATVQEINSQEFWGDFISSAATIFAKNIGGATSTHTHTITPSGSVSSTFTGKSMTSTGSFTPSGSISKITHKPSGSVTISATDSTSGNYTPAGSISKPNVTVTPSTSSFLTGSSLKASLASDTLTLSVDTSSGSAMTSATAALASTPTFTGTKVAISGSFSGTEFSVTPSFTGTAGTVSVSGTTTGSVSSSFTGTQSQTSTPV